MNQISSTQRLLLNQAQQLQQQLQDTVDNLPSLTPLQNTIQELKKSSRNIPITIPTPPVVIIPTPEVKVNESVIHTPLISTPGESIIVPVVDIEEKYKELTLPKEGLFGLLLKKVRTTSKKK